MTTLDLIATLTAPMHHGAGTAGNTSILRTHEVLQPDGTTARVPYLSANSVRHGLRDALAWHTASTLRVEPGSLSKPIVDLLWSGGAVTSTGAQVDLEITRDINRLYPVLTLLGYSAKSDITSGTLRVSDLDLACRENVWRMPNTLIDHPCTQHRAGAYRTETFGTRHDIASTPVARFIDLADTLVGTTQMIYDLQVLKPGSILYGTLMLTPAATTEHQRLLLAALNLWAPGGRAHLGAKSAAGYGAAQVQGYDQGAATTALEWWTGHLIENRDAVLDLLRGIV